MAKFSGDPAIINRPVAQVWDRMSNVGQYQTYLDRLPQEVKDKIGDVRFTDDAILINAAPVGQITLRKSLMEPPSKMVLEAENAPVPMRLVLNVRPGEKGEECSSEVEPVIDVEIPAMARPFVAPKLQAAASQMSLLIERLFAGEQA